jgi:hypothetical protein
MVYIEVTLHFAKYGVRAGEDAFGIALSLPLFWLRPAHRLHRDYMTLCSLLRHLTPVGAGHQRFK